MLAFLFTFNYHYQTLDQLSFMCHLWFQSIDISAEVTHEHDSNHIKSALSGSYAGQTVSTNINLDKSVADKYVAEAGLSYPGRTLSFESDVTKMIDGEHKMTMSTQWAADSDSKMSATASYKPGTTHEVTTDIKIPGHPMTLSATVKWVTLLSVSSIIFLCLM